jgi:hypothetical protein
MTWASAILPSREESDVNVNNVNNVNNVGIFNDNATMSNFSSERCRDELQLL